MSRRLIGRTVQTLLRKAGFELIRYPLPVADQFTDLSEEDRRTLLRVKPMTMTSAARIVSLIEAVRYIVQANIPGDIVECGVWRGGSMMAVAHTLINCSDTRRKLFLFDTFEGMSEPTTHDRRSGSGQLASELLASSSKVETVWCVAGIDDVKRNLRSTRYPWENIRFVKGKVEDTIPHHETGQIALLRLDTDWYESTRHELVHLFPKLVSGGVLIIDDYGDWEGARRAVDEYFAGALKHRPLLHRIDSTGRIMIKP